MYSNHIMEDLNSNTKDNNKLKMIQNLLKKQILNNERRTAVLNILSYLEYQQSDNEDGIHLQSEIELPSKSAKNIT